MLKNESGTEMKPDVFQLLGNHLGFVVEATGHGTIHMIWQVVDDSGFIASWLSVWVCLCCALSTELQAVRTNLMAVIFKLKRWGEYGEYQPLWIRHDSSLKVYVDGCCMLQYMSVEGDIQVQSYSTAV